MATKKVKVEAHERKGTKGVSAHMREQEVPDVVVDSVDEMKRVLLSSAFNDRKADFDAARKLSSASQRYAFMEKNQQYFLNDPDMAGEFVAETFDLGKPEAREVVRVQKIMGTGFVKDQVTDMIDENPRVAVQLAVNAPEDRKFMELCMSEGMISASQCDSGPDFVEFACETLIDTPHFGDALIQGFNADANLKDMSVQNFMMYSEGWSHLGEITDIVYAKNLTEAAGWIIENSELSNADDELESVLVECVATGASMDVLAKAAAQRPVGHFDSYMVEQSPGRIADYMNNVTVSPHMKQDLWASYLDDGIHDRIGIEALDLMRSNRDLIDTAEKRQRTFAAMSKSGTADLLIAIADEADAMGETRKTIFNRIMKEGTADEKARLAAKLS